MSGNFFIGESVIGCSSLSISAEQACRTFPLMFIVQEPQTSSRQAASQAGGVVVLPSAVRGSRWICISTEMTFALGRQGTWNSSQRFGPFGPSWRSMRTTVLRSSVIVPRLGLQNGVLDLQALERLERHGRLVLGEARHRDLAELLVARSPGLHELRIVLGILRRGFRQHEVGLVVAAAALVPHAARLEDDVGQLEHVPE